MDISVCVEDTIDIYIPILLDEETNNLYEDL